MIQLKSTMQYKTSFFLTALGQFLASFNVFLGMYFMFQRFRNVRGYGYGEVLLCCGILLMEFSLAETFARGFDQFSSIIGNGTFDRIMAVSYTHLDVYKRQVYGHPLATIIT